MNCVSQEAAGAFGDAIRIINGELTSSLEAVVQEAVAKQHRESLQLDALEPIWLLAYSDDSASRRLLESYVNSSLPRERLAAAVGIILSHDLSRIHLVVSLLRDSVEDVRKSSAALLGWHGGDYVVELVKSIESVDPDTLRIFISVIGSKYADVVFTSLH